MPKNFLFGVSPNGWTDNLKAMAWLERLFGPDSTSERVATNDGTRKWRLLTFDGHISHVNQAFLHRCLDYQVLPVCLPPHTTHFLQPLDVSVFGPLKRAYSDLLQAQYAKGERGVWKGNFYKLLDSAQKKAFTSTNILSGFRHTGLWPVDFSIVEERMDFGSESRESEIHALCRPVIPPSIAITFKLLVCLLTFGMTDDTITVPSILSLT